MAMAGKGSRPTSSGDALLIFHLPDACLTLAEGALDLWAEHLVWCYRFLGVQDGAVIAVQDYGTSPLSFLGSALLLPTMRAGVAERLGGRVICLDASHERVLLTPALLRQVSPDVLVVRAEVMGLLLEMTRRAGIELTRVASPKVIVALADERSAIPPVEGWRYLLQAESAMLLAPRCETCGLFHLRPDFYEVERGTVRNLRLPVGNSFPLPGLERAQRGGCPLGSEDWRIQLSLNPR